MQRNTWVFTDGSRLYPNLYTVLVAPPGVGKGKILNVSYALLKKLEDTHHVSHTSLTAASLIDNLNTATRSWVFPNKVPAVVSFNSLTVVAAELGVLLPIYDSAFMNKLQHLYDNVAYSELRRTGGLFIDMPNPQLSILAACTPGYLQSTLPEAAWAEGFTSRCIFVYSGQQTIASLFQPQADNSEQETLLDRLKRIGRVYGEFTFTPEARDLIDEWHLGGGQPRPDHPKLFNYVHRRTAHALKLSMVASISESLNLIITAEHVMRGIAWLLDVEENIPDIFKEMANTNHQQILRDTWHYIFDTYRKENRTPVVEARVINFVSQRVPAYNVSRVLDVLEKAGYVVKGPGKAGPEYTPKGLPR